MTAPRLFAAFVAKEGAPAPTGLVRTLMALLTPHRRTVLSTVVMSVAMGFVQVSGISAFLPILGLLSGKKLEDLAALPVVGKLVAFLPQNPSHAVAVLVFLLLLMILTRTGLNTAIRHAQMRMKNLILRDSQQEIVDHFLSLPPLNHSLENKSRFIQVVSVETLHLCNGVSSTVNLLAGTIQSVLLLLFLTVVSWQVMLCILLAILLVIWPMLRIFRRMLREAEKEALHGQHSIQAMIEVVRRVDLIDIFNTHAKELEHAHLFLERFMGARARMDKTRLIGPLMVEISVAFLVCGVVWYLVFMGSPQAAMGQVILFITGLAAIQPQLIRVNHALNDLARVEASATRIREILATRPLPRVNLLPGESAPPQPQDWGLTLENVSFAYPGAADAPPVLNNVSLAIPAGQLTMIFGASGAGKTTFLRLTQRLLKPDSGIIRLGGVDIRAFPDALWSQWVLLMNQENQVFAGTVEENIAYGNGDPAPEAIRQAARQARVMAFLSETEGLQRATGPEGSLLSGGQRQRVSLARILAKQPKVLVLDEPTSALDRHLEKELLVELAALRGAGTTILMSTHKVDLAPLADRLLWFEEGVIHEGSFDQFQEQLDRLRISRRDLTPES